MKKYLYDVFALFALTACQLYLLATHLDFQFQAPHGDRIVALLLSLTPLYAAYFFSRLLLPCLAATLLTGGLNYLLTKIHVVKQALTTVPLTWTDISRTDNLSVAPHYLAWHHIALAVVALAGFVLLYRVDPTRRLRLGGLSLALIFGLLSLHPYTAGMENRLGQTLRFALLKHDINYIVWDWPANVRQNGLLTHLIQTSQRRIPVAPDAEQQQQFTLLRQSIQAPLATPTNIIVILCEACWHNDTHFNDAFAPLRDIGFEPFRAVSPVYGGGTVNAAFELLTGLPANGALNGVIYQEYTHLLSDQALSWPRSLEADDYASIALHNHYRRFWNRDIITNKLGFRQFVALEDMDYDGPIWASDTVLFHAAAQALNAPPTHHFAFLTTVSTHGGYASRDNDDGQQEYAEKLQIALQDVAQFAQRVLRRAPDSLILVVGDHKPALTRFFHREQIFLDEDFLNTGERNEDYAFSPRIPQTRLGDVPGYVYYRDQKLSPALHGQPFFCLTQILNAATVRAELPAFAYAQQYELCAPSSRLTYRQRSLSYPSWLYAASLFAKPAQTP